jgi:hypothetical protein
MRHVPPLELGCQTINQRVNPEVPLAAMHPGGGIVQAHDDSQPERGAVNTGLERFAASLIEN